VQRNLVCIIYGLLKNDSEFEKNYKDKKESHAP
jgi:hypothetical protein